MNQLNVVPLATAKLWLRVDFDDDDAVITSLIKAAVNQVEQYTLQILWQRSLSARTDRYGVYRIFEYPLISIEDIIDGDGDSVLFEDCETEWYTEVRSDDNGLQTVNFVAGYGWTYDGGTEVPDDILTALKELITYWYEHRDNEQVKWPGVSKPLLDPYRRVTLF